MTPHRPRGGAPRGGPGSRQAAASRDGVHACPLPRPFPCLSASAVPGGRAPHLPSSPAPPVAPAPSEGSTCSERPPRAVCEDAGEGFPLPSGLDPWGLPVSVHASRSPRRPARTAAGPRAPLRPDAVTTRPASPGPRTPGISPGTGRPRPRQGSRRWAQTPCPQRAQGTNGG